MAAVVEALDRWHRLLAPLAAEVCRAIVVRRARPGVVREWAGRLEAVAREMREWS